MPEICRQVASDAMEEGINISDYGVELITGLFFSHAIMHMRQNDLVIIKGLGTFGITPKKKKVLDKEQVDKFYRDLIVKRHRNYRNYRKFQVKKMFERFNLMRQSKGLKPWSFDDYKQVHKIKIPRKLRRDSVLRKK